MYHNVQYGLEQDFLDCIRQHLACGPLTVMYGAIQPAALLRCATKLLFVYLYSKLVVTSGASEGLRIYTPARFDLTFLYGT